MTPYLVSLVLSLLATAPSISLHQSLFLCSFPPSPYLAFISDQRNGVIVFNLIYHFFFYFFPTKTGVTVKVAVSSLPLLSTPIVFSSSSFSFYAHFISIMQASPLPQPLLFSSTLPTPSWHFTVFLSTPICPFTSCSSMALSYVPVMRSLSQRTRAISLSRSKKANHASYLA